MKHSYITLAHFSYFLPCRLHVLNTWHTPLPCGIAPQVLAVMDHMQTGQNCLRCQNWKSGKSSQHDGIHPDKVVYKEVLFKRHSCTITQLHTFACGDI